MAKCYVYRSQSEDDTERLAWALADKFVAGTVIALDGDLGAGKTRFSQAVGRAIGVREPVNSPTFTIIKEYEGKRFPLYHMDVYRISLEEADELGLDDYFFGDGITLVEWASRIEDLLPAEYLHIWMEYDGERERTIRLQPHGRPYTDWCAELAAGGVNFNG